MKTNSKTKIITITAAVSAFAIIAVAANVTSGDSSGSEKTAKVPSEEVQKVVADGYLVKANSIDDEISATGTILANQEVNLVSEISRKVMGVYAKEGSFVRKGTLLFKLDDAELQARKKKLLLQEKLAIIEEKRFRELLASEAANQQEYDKILTNLQVLQADIEALNVELAKTEIKAPFDGKIGLNNVDKGAYVTPQTSLTYIEDVSNVKVIFTVPEKYVASIKPGQEITFTTESSSSPFTGKIVATESKTDITTRSLVVQALSDNKNGKLVPGTSAKISVRLQQIKDGMLVPTEALIPSQEGYSLFAVKNGQADKRTVKTGFRTKTSMQILEGLSAGDTVITSNIIRLGQGVPVQVHQLN